MLDYRTDFYEPSQAVSMKVRQGLWFVTGPVLYLRIAFYACMFIMIHVLYFVSHYTSVLPTGNAGNATLVISIVLYMFFGLLLYLRLSNHWFSDSSKRKLHVIWPLCFMGDLIVLTMDYLHIEEGLTLFVYVPVAILVFLWVVYALFLIFEEERILSRAVYSHKYKVMESFVSGKRTDPKGPGRNYASFVRTMDVTAENSKNYIIEVRTATYLSCRKGAEGYLISYEYRFKGKPHSVLYFSKGRTSNKFSRERRKNT